MSTRSYYRFDCVLHAVDLNDSSITVQFSELIIRQFQWSALKRVCEVTRIHMTPVIRSLKSIDYLNGRKSFSSRIAAIARPHVRS